MRWRIDYNEAVAAADAPSSRPNRPAGRQGLTELTAVAAVTAMRSGDLKAEDYAGALLDRAQHLESLNAFRTLDKEMVLEAARAADKVRARGDAMGLLHGLPVPVKDSIDSKALPTSNGTRALRDFRPRHDAGVLKSLLAQGGILMGKTNLHELSYGWTSSNAIFGPVRNPYDPRRVAGGSSGGSVPLLPLEWRRWPSPRTRWDLFASRPRCADWQGCARPSAVTPAMGSCRSRMPSLIRPVPWRVALPTSRCSMRR